MMNAISTSMAQRRMLAHFQRPSLGHGATIVLLSTRPRDKVLTQPLGEVISKMVLAPSCGQAESAAVRSRSWDTTNGAQEDIHGVFRAYLQRAVNIGNK